MVITFTSENAFGEKRVEMMLRPKITAQNTTHQIQTGTCPVLHAESRRGEARPSATVHVNQ
ncbi:hypothetical protein KPZU40_00010 [Klebsiella pneumoniae]|nr:hypothetical protein KPZU40_00010 [Klebsiella pneumoniae]